MAKAELGAKRRCLTCGAPFYDLNGRSNAQSKLFLNIFVEFAFSRTFES